MIGGKNTNSNIPDAIIDDSGGRKYIVARVTDPKGSSRLVVRANEWCDYHRDILNNLRKKCGADFKVQCIGGGYIRVDDEKRKIIIWGSSADFGVEPDRKGTVKILQGAFPDFTVLNK